MSRLEEKAKLKEILADMIENLEDNWKSHSERNEGINDVVEELLNRREDYAREVAQASLEKADKGFKNSAVKSIGTALKYFEERNHDTIYKRDIISFLHAFYQFESQGLSIVGMGYKRYDGKEITDLEGAYEGGYFTEKKRYEITNPDNIIML